MQRWIIIILWICSFIVAGWSFLAFGTGQGFLVYLQVWAEQKISTNNKVSPLIVRAFSAWHETSYASMQWMKLIQFIGGNTLDAKNMNTLLSSTEFITKLHPYFAKPYELGLLLLPTTSSWEQSHTGHVSQAINIAKQWIDIFCDHEKIKIIRSLPISENLWNRDDLKNPCNSGILPYYLAFTIHKNQNNASDAVWYYKIASMHDDAPTASRILSIIAKSGDGDHRKSALSFFLIGQSGYDAPNRACQRIAHNLAKTINMQLNEDSIRSLKKMEEKLLMPSEDDPLMQWSFGCYNLTTSGIAELYLAYITQQAQGTNIKNADELVKIWKIPYIPTLKGKTHTTAIKENNVWQYRERAQ